MPYQTGSIITVQQAADQSPVKARENPGQPRAVSKGQNIYFLPRTVNIRAQTALPLVVISRDTSDVPESHDAACALTPRIQLPVCE